MKAVHYDKVYKKLGMHVGERDIYWLTNFIYKYFIYLLV